MSKTGFATIETNKYGLSPTLAGEKVQAKIFYDHVEFYHDHRLIGRFPRSYKTNDEIYDWTQYVSTLCKKPGAIEHTRFFRQIPQRWQEYLAATKGKERKSALQLLSEIVADGNAEFCDDALELAAANGRADVDSLRQCYYMIAKKEYRPDPLKLSSGPLLNYNPNLSAYDGLMGVRLIAEQIEQLMRQVKLGGMAKGWRSVPYENTEQYVTDLLMLELQEREANRINRMVKTAGFRVLKTLDDFVWNSAIELPGGMTQEYMTDLHFLTPKENLIFMGSCWNRKDPSGYGYCFESLPGGAACPILYCG